MKTVKADVESNQIDPIVELKKIPKTEWARIWCELNSWKIPKELKHIKPNCLIKEMSFLRLLMDYIEYIIGEKACLRCWNKDYMTDEQFEIFFRNLTR